MACLWRQVDGHLERFADLPELVDGVVGSEMHPHAVDGARLRELAGLGGTGSTVGSAADAASAPAAPGAQAVGGGEVDIVALLEGWVDKVEAMEAQIAQLDGGSGDARGGAAAAAAAPTPLLATADARSHAPHLFAQLGLHRACLQGMRELESALDDELAATGGFVG